MHATLLGGASKGFDAEFILVVLGILFMMMHIGSIISGMIFASDVLSYLSQLNLKVNIDDDCITVSENYTSYMLGSGLGILFIELFQIGVVWIMLRQQPLNCIHTFLMLISRIVALALVIEAIEAGPNPSYLSGPRCSVEMNYSSTVYAAAVAYLVLNVVWMSVTLAIFVISLIKKSSTSGLGRSSTIALPSRPSASSPPPVVGPWICAYCNGVNTTLATDCVTCKQPKFASATPPSAAMIARLTTPAPVVAPVVSVVAPDLAPTAAPMTIVVPKGAILSDKILAVCVITTPYRLTTAQLFDLLCTVYRVVYAGGAPVRTGIELTSVLCYTLALGAAIEVTDIVVNSQNIRRAKLADGSGWTSLLDTDGVPVLEPLAMPPAPAAPVGVPSPLLLSTPPTPPTTHAVVPMSSAPARDLAVAIPAASGTTGAALGEKAWTCAYCRSPNVAGTNVCNTCKQEKYVPASGSKAVARTLSKGSAGGAAPPVGSGFTDWICTYCRSTNVAASFVCAGCKKEKYIA